MNTRKSLLVAAAAFFATAASSFADVTVVLTGSTAFRAAVNDSIKAMLTGETVRFVPGSSSGLNNSNTAIFRGTHATLGTVTIQTAWSGSGTGVSALVANSDVNVLPLAVLNEGTAGTEAAAVATTTVAAKATFAFSDVKQESTTAANLAALPAPSAVGIIPFIFVASESAPAGITNITDQQVYQLLNAGFVPASLLSGNPADDSIAIHPVGRDSGSGTRITVLAETGYGINNAVNQALPTSTGTGANVVLTSAGEGGRGNGGETSGGTLATWLSGTSSGFALVGYVGVSDATTAQTNGARWLAYNGASYTPANVKNGVYTLWSEVQLYPKVAALNANETSFKTLFLSQVDTYLLSNETRGIALSSMRVSRPSDGGPVSSNL